MSFTLQVCKFVPEATGFDVEIKFPTPIEEQNYGVKVTDPLFVQSFFTLTKVLRLIATLFVTGIST
jgi:hypothetical protein